MNKVIVLTKHAEKRIKERDITEKQIKKVLEKAVATKWKDNLQVKDYKGIKVVFEEKDDVINVITTYKIDNNLEIEVSKIPEPHEWWKEEDKQVFVNQAYWLQARGIDTDVIIEHLKVLFKAVCGEFGE
jgi:hypothetical protein